MNTMNTMAHTPKTKMRVTELEQVFGFDGVLNAHSALVKKIEEYGNALGNFDEMLHRDVRNEITAFTLGNGGLWECANSAEAIELINNEIARHQVLLDAIPNKRAQQKPKKLINIKDVAGTEHDFEWYPTTNEIIDSISGHIKSFVSRYSPSVLDCGAGDGRVLLGLTDGERYAIEKSQPLLSVLDRSIKLAGTDFHNQTLLDKKVDVIFCNPPYSEYVQWATKIIREGFANHIYLVIPDRWVDNDEINFAIKQRKAKANVIGSFDFLNAERRARAKVNVLHIRIYSDGDNTDAFSLWFNETFSVGAVCEVEAQLEKSELEQRYAKHKQNELAKGTDNIQTLVKNYNDDLETMLVTYRELSGVSASLLRLLGIGLSQAKDALRERIKSLKGSYWAKVFTVLTAVTSRLTTKTRKKLLDSMTTTVMLDFSYDNIHAIVAWVLRHSNEYMETQFIEAMTALSEVTNCTLYKSNKKLYKDVDWRYLKMGESDSPSHYKLEYRMVLSCRGGIEVYHPNSSVNGLSDIAIEFLNDICTIASNFGYVVHGSSVVASKFESGKSVEIMCLCPKLGEVVPMLKVKAFKNGNLHVHFNQRLIQKMNVEFGRLCGWLKNPDEASVELNIPMNEVVEDYGSMLRYNDGVALAICNKTGSGIE